MTTAVEEVRVVANPAYVVAWVDKHNRIRGCGIYSEQTPTQIDMRSYRRPHLLCTVYMPSFHQAYEYAEQWLRRFSPSLHGCLKKST